MAVPANFSCPDREKFQYCYSKLINFKYREEDPVKTDFNLLIDQLNSLEYSTVIVTEQTGNKLLNKLCVTIPLHDDRLVVKFCQLTNTWQRKQMLQLDDQCLNILTNYLIKAVERCQKWTTAEILAALASVVYENVDRLEEFHPQLLGKQGILVQLINNEITDSNTLEQAVLCVECLTLKPSTSLGYLSLEYLEVCFELFCMLLHKVPSTNVEQTLQCKIIVNCLRGIQNMIQMTKLVPHSKLGVILAALRAYMFYGVYSQPPMIADSLYPSPLVKVDVPVQGKLSDTNNKSTDKQEESGQKKSKRKTKKKSDRQSGKPNSQDNRSHGDDLGIGERSLGASSTFGTSMEADLSGYTTWSKISSSESEWSDTEGGQGSRLRSICTKVRQCSLSCFYWIAKMIDKKLMFSYWSCFIPDSQNSNDSQTLFTIIQKDPSPKCRMGALAALSVLVDGTKLLLTAAEDRDERKTVAFTPFSVILGSTIKEIHKCLLQAMVCEDYPITLTQLIKCFGIVIANVPYHRMRPGLLSRIIKQIKHFINHRDPNVRVACLTCLGAMAAIQPPLMEICHIVQPSRPPVSAKQPVAVDADGSIVQDQAFRDADSGLNIPNQASKDTESGVSNSPGIHSPGGALQFGGTGYGENSGNITPNRGGTAGSSGLQTPVFTDQVLQSHATDTSWVVKLCVKNILPQSSPDVFFGAEDFRAEPIPVRLESLQVLANLTKGYFPIIRNCVPLLQDLIHQCFCDRDPVIKLHTAKLLDEFSQVLLQDVANTGSEKQVNSKLDLAQVLEFWLSLLNGPIQDILQNASNGAVKASTCDCIANIGDAVFKLLPLDKRIMCLTVVLGLANDEDRFIRASAIRTLGVYVLYRCVREDVSFIADATSAVLGAMEDKNIAVRVKAAWSLANLGDALALNREEGDADFLADFSDVLALNVVTIATRACQDSDKVKPNGVRALGNILRFVTSKQLGKEAFNQAVSAGVRVLVKCVSSGAMKVRWNACYAISNMYKNTDLKQETSSWNVDVLRVLCVVVKECKNFKVRINAAIALSAPRHRCMYGDMTTYCSVWSGVVDAFNTAEEIDEFVNFKYRDNLVEQLCVAALHLMSVLDVEDTVELLPFLQSKGELLTYSLDKYYSVRQKGSQIGIELEAAKTRLKVLSTQEISASQSTCVDILNTVCSQLSLGIIDFDPLTMKTDTTFLQSYD